MKHEFSQHTPDLIDIKCYFVSDKVVRELISTNKVNKYRKYLMDEKQMIELINTYNNITNF